MIVFDNLSSLTSGIDENSNSEMDLLVQFFRELRHLGYTVIFVHHAGKGGEQRGGSRREDQLDLVMKPSAPEERTNPPSALLEFEKTRGRPPDPMSLTIALQADEQKMLRMAVVGDSGRDAKGAYLREGIGELFHWWVGRKKEPFYKKDVEDLRDEIFVKKPLPRSKAGAVVTFGVAQLKVIEETGEIKPRSVHSSLTFKDGYDPDPF